MNLTDDERRMLLHELLNMGENMLSCGGEVSRVEETLSLMGKAYGAERTNVFCITSSMVLTIQFPIRQELTQTRRLSLGANDFVKLERYNDLSRHCCEKPLPVKELRERIQEIESRTHSRPVFYGGSALGAFAFAMFFGGTLWDGLAAALLGLFVCFLQEKLPRYSSGRFIYNLLISLATALVIGSICHFVPFLHEDKILIGEVMLMIPGIAMTNAVRDILVGNTIAGLLRLVESVLWAGALAAGVMIALLLVSGPETELAANPLWVEFLMAMLGSLGFSILFHVRGRLLPYAALGGLLTWAVYRLMLQFTAVPESASVSSLIQAFSTGGVFLPTLAAAAFAALYAEILARFLKTPATVLYIPAVVPLIPGSTLYYTMAGVVRTSESALTYGSLTLAYTLAIAVGTAAIWAVFFAIRQIKLRKKA